MNKQQIENMCRKAGLLPVHKERIFDVDVLVADGFVSPANMHKFKKFEIDEDQFPMGCYCTFWWAMKDEENFGIGKPLFCEWNHDTEYGQDSKQPMRINAALEEVREILGRAKSVVMGQGGAYG